MQKSKGIKIAALLCGAVVVIAGAVLVVSHFIKKEDAYRSILVYELEGTAEIEREKTGSIRAAENIYLESGDRLTVDAGSFMRLKLDDDKYIMVEENSVLSIEAVGDEKDSKTKIQLEKGAVTSEIQNPLSTDSQYEVTSPNSVMAVRGTIFRVETDIVKGESCTKTSVFSGKVAMGVRLEDGTMGDEVLIRAGEEGTGEGNKPVTSDKTDYSKLPPQAIRVLQELSEQGASIEGLSKSELDKLAGNQDKSDKTEDKKDTDSSENKQEEDSQKPDSDSAGNTDRPNNKQAGNNSSRKNTAGTTGSTVPGSTAAVGNTVDNVPDNAAGTGTTGQPDSNISETKPGGSNADEEKPGGNNTEDDKPDVDEKTEFTVTFMYQGKVFATQTVESGQCVKKPTLMPAPFGAWDFDFSTKITKDITITWK